MACLAVILLSLFVITINGCPEPQTTVHIQNYDGPIILHSANCDDQLRILTNPCNQYDNPYNQYNPCDNDCTCVSQQSYYPYNPTPQNVYYPAVTQSSCYPTTTQGGCYSNTVQSGCYPTATVSSYPMATNLGCGNQYSVVETTYSGYNSCNKCGGCQCGGFC